jgi:hypothetical protein
VHKQDTVVPGSKSETRGRWRFFDGLGSNIVVQYSVGPIIVLVDRIIAREYVDRLSNQVHPMIQTLFPNNVVVFQEYIVPIHTAGNVRFTRDLKRMKANFNIFPGQHNHQI